MRGPWHSRVLAVAPYLAAALVVAACSEARTLTNAEACKVLSAPDRQHHLGETVTFRGEFTSDMERAVIRPVGCRYGVGLGSMDSQSADIVQKLAPPFLVKRGKNIGPTGVRATFTGTLILGAPNGMMFRQDDRVRLNVTRTEHAESFVWDPGIYL